MASFREIRASDFDTHSSNGFVPRLVNAPRVAPPCRSAPGTPAVLALPGLGPRWVRSAQRAAQLQQVASGPARLHGVSRAMGLFLAAEPRLDLAPGGTRGGFVRHAGNGFVRSAYRSRLIP